MVTVWSRSRTSSGRFKLQIWKKAQPVQSKAPKETVKPVKEVPKEEAKPATEEPKPEKKILKRIKATDNQELLQKAYEQAQKIDDEKVRAQALLDVINEINYFSSQKQPAADN